MRTAMPSLAFRGSNFRRVCALVCLALFFALELFASSGPLHKLIHRDADSSQHQCAITLLTQGQLNSPEVSLPLMVFIAALIFFLPPLQTAIFLSFDYRFSSSRAPPRF
jgi:hypothetical protein